TNPLELIFEPAGRKKLTWVICEGTPPVDSVPLIVYFASPAAPAPRMLPVPGNPAIGTALALSVTTGAAEATPARLRTARPSKARQVDALRIRFSPLVDGQVRLDPGGSGTMPVRRYRDLARPTPEHTA